MSSHPSFELAGTVVAGGRRHRIKFLDDVEYGRIVNRFGVGTCLTITLEETKEHRSKTWAQVKYWKGHVCPLVGDHCGYTVKQADLMLLGEKFGYVQVNRHELPKVTSISDLSVEEMTELIEWALDWVPAHLEIILLPPDKDWKLTQKEIRTGKRRSHAA